MKAPDLEIQILASVAKLQEDMRQIERTVGKVTDTIGTQARRANSNLRDIGKGSSAGVQEFSREVSRLKASIDPAWAALERYKYQVDLLRVAQRQGAITQAQYLQQVRLAKNTYQEASRGITAQTGAMQAGFQQAGYQASDFFVQVGGGTSAIRAASQQMPQMIQALSLMGSGADGAKGKFGALLGFFAGPWGVGLTVAASVVGVLATSLLEAEDASSKAEFASYGLSDAQSILGNVVDLTTGKIKTQSNALLALAKAQAIAGQIQARARQAEARGALQDEAGYRTIISGNFGGGLRLDRARDASGDMAEAFLEGSLNTKEMVAGLDSLRKTGYLTEQQFLDLAKSATSFGVEAENIKVFEDLEKALGGDTAAMQQFLNVNERTRRASRARNEALSEEEKALKRQTEETNRFIESLQQEVDEMGKSPSQLRQMEIARQMEAAATKEQRAEIERLNIAREDAFTTQEREKAIEADRKATASLKDRLKALDDEFRLIGMVGPARELAALALEEEAFKAKAAKDGIFDVAQAWEEYLAARTRNINAQTALDVDAEKARILQDELSYLIDSVTRLGVVGQGVGGILGILTGNTRDVGGPLGELLNQKIGIDTILDKDGNPQVIAKTIGSELSEIFKLDGTFGKTMKSLFGGATTGLTISNAFGFDSTKSQVGSAIGGALGQVAGEKIGEMVGGTIGKALGPLGAIAGGLLGGALGSLLNGSKPYGTAQVSGGGVSVSAKGGSRFNDAAGDLASSVQDGLSNIADELGANIGNYLVSIGVYNDSFRVSTTGYSGGKLNFKGSSANGLHAFDSAEDAVKFAILDAIKDGAIQGLSAAEEALLKKAKSLEEAISDVMTFRGVFDQLKSYKDPTGFAMDELEKEFDRLFDLFKRAGASAEQYAQLEELLAIRRDEAMQSVRDDMLEKLRPKRELEIRILELLGKQEDALAAARELELEGMKESLRPLQSMVYQLEDARAIMAQFEPLADDLRAFKQELLSTGSKDTFAVIAARFNETAALAKNGDATALSNLRDTASEFLDAAKDNARSELEYRRAVGQVMGAVDDGIFAADSQIEYAQMQIDAIDAQTDILTSIRDQLNTQQAVIAANTARTVTLLQRFEGEGLRVVTDDDTPLKVDVL